MPELTSSCGIRSTRSGRSLTLRPQSPPKVGVCKLGGRVMIVTSLGALGQFSLRGGSVETDGARARHNWHLPPDHIPGLWRNSSLLVQWRRNGDVAQPAAHFAGYEVIHAVLEGHPREFQLWIWLHDLRLLLEQKSKHHTLPNHYTQHAASACRCIECKRTALIQC